MTTQPSGENTQGRTLTKSEFGSTRYLHPHDEDHSVIIYGSGYPSIGRICAQLTAMDPSQSMPSFVRRLSVDYDPELGQFGTYMVDVVFTREAYPGQYDAT